MELFVPAEGIGGLCPQGFFLDDKFRSGRFKDFVGTGETHFILEALCEPERLRKADLFLGGVVRELGTVDIHILEVELGETAFLGQRDAGLTQGKVEMDAGVIDLVSGFQSPYAVNGSREITGMSDS